MFFPYGIDVFVVGDVFEGDMGDGVVVEAFFGVGGVFEFVVREGGAHDSRTRERKGDARGVAGDPTPAPLFGDEGGCAGAASGV